MVVIALPMIRLVFHLDSIHFLPGYASLKEFNVRVKETFRVCDCCLKEKSVAKERVEFAVTDSNTRLLNVDKIYILKKRPNIGNKMLLLCRSLKHPPGRLGCISSFTFLSFFLWYSLFWGGWGEGEVWSSEWHAL